MSALDHMGLTFLRTLMWRMKELGQIQVRFVASMDFVPGIEPQEEKTGRGKGAWGCWWANGNLSVAKTNIFDYLEATARRLPQKTALSDGKSEVTFGAWLDSAKRVGKNGIISA